MRKRDLTKTDLQNFAAFLEHRFGVRFLDSSCREELKEIADALRLLGVGDPNAYLRRYAFTVGILISTPFELGEPLPGWPLDWQFYTLGHETSHGDRYLKGGRERWQSSYLLDAEFRALEELQAYAVNLELHFAFTGEFLAPERLANTLMNYACNVKQIEMVRVGLEQRRPTIEAGGIINPVSQAAVEWATANGVL